jgi:lipoate-protein ligase B
VLDLGCGPGWHLSSLPERTAGLDGAAAMLEIAAQHAPGAPLMRADLRALEGVCTRVIGRFGVEGGPDPRNTGVWVGGQKIAAIGVAARRWVTWHGFSINIDVDLGYFRRVNPCGMGSELVTRLADHVSPCPRLRAVADGAGAELRRWWAEWSALPAEAAEGAPSPRPEGGGASGSDPSNLTS